MKKTYADQCLERAEKATEQTTKEIKRQLTIKKSEITCIGYPYVALNGEDLLTVIAHSRTDVPELARRLNIACEALRAQSGYFAGRNDYRYDETHELYKLADELERI